MDGLLSVLTAIEDFVWSKYLLIPVLLGTGIFLTFRLGLVQFTRLGAALRLGLLQRDDDGGEGDVSQYQALTTALAATVGVGNIVGVATAIAMGGPGALFWMWMTALFGMASKYTEAFLGVRFRRTDTNGQQSGGPQYYLRDGLIHRFGPKWAGFGTFLSVLFAVFAVLASFGIGNMTQGNAVAEQMEGAFGVDPLITGIVLVLLTGLVLIGGIKVIGKVTAAFVPLMILIYLGGGTAVLISNADHLGGAFGQIFSDAFSGTAAVGGFVGSTIMLAIQYGVARGLFSNESGMGSAAIAAAAAKTTHPTRQGLVSMTQTFIDTIIVVTFTGLVVISSGVWQQDPDTAGTMTGEAFHLAFAGGDKIVAVSIAFFAFSTILGWSYYGERCAERLGGVTFASVYRLIFTAVVLLGCIAELDVVWSIAGTLNGLMALPNLLGLLLLSGLVAKETRYYLRHDPKLRAGASDVAEFMRNAPDTAYSAKK